MELIVTQRINCVCFVPTLLVEFVNYLELHPADVEQVGVEDGEGYAAVVGVVRLKKSDEEVEHNLWNVRKAAGIVDIVVWLVINLGCLIMGIAALQSAHSSYLEEIDSLVEATNAYENLFAAP